MGEGDDEKGDLPKLRRREDFHGWKEKMLLYSMEKGDTEGIFSDARPNVPPKVAPRDARARTTLRAVGRLVEVDVTWAVRR